MQHIAPSIPSAPRKPARKARDVKPSASVSRVLFGEDAPSAPRSLIAFSCGENMNEVDNQIDSMLSSDIKFKCTFETTWSIRFAVTEPGKPLATSETLMFFEVHGLPVSITLNDDKVSCSVLSDYTVNNSLRLLFESTIKGKVMPVVHGSFGNDTKFRENFPGLSKIDDLNIDFDTTQVLGPHLTKHIANQIFIEVFKYFFN